MVAAALLAINFLSCNTNGGQTAKVSYDHSVDVPSREWRAQDTLFFPITISDEPEVRTSIIRGTDYPVWCSIRMTSDYPFTTVPMTLIIQQTDTTAQGGERVKRNYLRQHIEPVVRTPEGRPLGSSWGSLIQHEVRLDSLSLRFDSVGHYRMLLIPAVQGEVTLCGIASVGLSL